MKTCIIFAACIFEESKLNALIDFFQAFTNNFGDADIYVGINYGCLPDLEDIIKSFGLNCKVSRVTDSNLYTATDASAYQEALKLLKQSNQTYDIYWVAHTKGGVNSRDSIRQMYLHEMFYKRSYIEAMFSDYAQLGSWGLRGNSVSAANVQWKEYNVDSIIPICSNTKISPFNFTHVIWSYIETLYVLKKEAVEAYLNFVNDDFFNTKLNPWYFETVFPWTPSRCGYFPYVKIKRDFWDHCELTDITKKWIEENKLDLKDYINL